MIEMIGIYEDYTNRPEMLIRNPHDLPSPASHPFINGSLVDILENAN